MGKENFEPQNNEKINLDEANKRWREMNSGERQFWVSRFYGVTEENKRQFVSRVMKAKHSSFDQLGDELVNFLAKEAWKVEVSR